MSSDHLEELTTSLDYRVFKLMTVVVALTLNGMIVGVGVSCHRVCLGIDVTELTCLPFIGAHSGYTCGTNFCRILTKILYRVKSIK